MATCRGFLWPSARGICFQNVGLVECKDREFDRSACGQIEIGAPDGIRTHGPQIRNLMLYPAELRVLLF
jgi:hypothetical protein